MSDTRIAYWFGMAIFLGSPWIANDERAGTGMILGAILIASSWIIGEIRLSKEEGEKNK